MWVHYEPLTNCDVRLECKSLSHARRRLKPSPKLQPAFLEIVPKSFELYKRPSVDTNVVRQQKSL